jgi:hypothetical protein
MKLSRRSTLGACATALAGWLSAGAAVRLWAARPAGRGTDSEKTAAARHVGLGLAYLRRYPDEASQVLLAGLVPSDPVLRARQVRADFTAGQVVSLGGWVLSRTECRYCALHALAGAGRG